jgi:hypothetical protein
LPSLAGRRHLDFQPDIHGNQSSGCASQTAPIGSSGITKSPARFTVARQSCCNMGFRRIRQDILKTMIEFTCQEEDNYLLITSKGDYDVDYITANLPKLVDIASSAKRTRILIDAFSIPPPKSEIDRFFLGQAFAAILRPPLRVALLYPAEFINKFMEDTAVNRGAFLFVSGDKDEALRWLLSDS